jgi:hypothetical protein
MQFNEGKSFRDWANMLQEHRIQGSYGNQEVTFILEGSPHNIALCIAENEVILVIQERNALKKR